MSQNHELPDLFRFENGGLVRNQEDWRRRRKEIADSIVRIEYGGLPPTPLATKAEELHSFPAQSFLNARFIQYRISIEQSSWFGFRLDLLVPVGTGPFPVVLTGDACWRYLTDEITLEFVKREYILAQFSRVEIVPDTTHFARDTGLYRVFPEGKYGAISAWAWAHHRCVDVLRTLPQVDPNRIAVLGHSRGGNTTLLAGATDERIALTIANNSGCGGAGCFRWQGPESETLGHMMKAFPHWLSPGMAEYAGREETLPFDQHSLKALIAPRALLTTVALDDLWANPTGIWQTHLAAREVYRFLGAEKNLRIKFRPGEHTQIMADWLACLDFIDFHFLGKPLPPSFDSNPFSNLPPCHSWRAPAPT